MSKIQVEGNRNHVRGDSRTKISISIGTVVIVFAIIFVFFLSSNSIEKRIIGTWQKIDEESDKEKLYKFTKDGQFICISDSNDAKIAYKIDGKKIQLDVQYIILGNYTVFADIDISGNKLTLSNFIDPDHGLGLSTDDVLIFKKIKE